MSSNLLLLFLISFLIFFRTDVVKILAKFERYHYFLSGFILFLFNYFILLNQRGIHQFILIFANLILLLTNKITWLVESLGLDFLQTRVTWTLKSLILAFLVFYPLYYQKKFESSVFKTERISIRVIYFVLTVFFYFFCLHFNI